MKCHRMSFGGHNIVITSPGDISELDWKMSLQAYKVLGATLSYHETFNHDCSTWGHAVLS